MMEKVLSNKISASLVGLFQALAVVGYSSLVAGFIYFMSQTRAQMGYLGVALLLVLLVFSAGLTGTFVFGLPAYFALKNNINQAILILVYTFLYILLIILITVFIILAFA